MRIVSLLPSATEVVCLVAAHCPAGAAHFQLVGRSHECDYPAGLDHLPMLTAAKTTFTNSADVDQQVREALASGAGLYTVDQQQLQQLKPDAILTQSLCSVCSVDLCQVQRIAAGLQPPPLIIDLNPQNLQEVLEDVARVGEQLGEPAAGVAAAAALQARIDAAVAAVPAGAEPADQQAAGNGAQNGDQIGGQGQQADGAAAGSRPSVAFIEWAAPIFVGGHWTPQLIHMAGGRHPLNPPKDGGGAGKSFVATPQQVVDSNPDWVVVAPCGLDLATTRREFESNLAKEPWWQELPAVKAGRVALVDGNQMFNRPGPRLVDALEFLVGLLYGKPEFIPRDFPYELWRPANRQ